MRAGPELKADWSQEFPVPLLRLSSVHHGSMHVKLLQRPCNRHGALSCNHQRCTQQMACRLELELVPSRRAGGGGERSERCVLVPWCQRLTTGLSSRSWPAPLLSGCCHVPTITVVRLDSWVDNAQPHNSVAPVDPTRLCMALSVPSRHVHAEARGTCQISLIVGGRSSVAASWLPCC